MLDRVRSIVRDVFLDRKWPQIIHRFSTKVDESFYCLYGKQEILFAVGKQYVSANIHPRFWGDARVNKQMLGLVFQFLRFFLILFLLFGRRKWILNIEVDYDTVCESFRGIKLSYSLIESLSLIFIEIESTRTRLSCVSRSRSTIY